MRPLLRCHPLLRPFGSQRGASLPFPRPRRFHSSPPQQFPAELFELSHTITQYIHTISGTSWAGSLLLTGGLWRLAWCPVQSFISSNQNKSITIRPLERAWRQVIVKQAEHRFEPTPGVANTAGNWVDSEFRKVLAKLRVTHGIKSYLPIVSNLVFIPIFIANADVVRRMAGQAGGITTFLRKNNIDPGEIPPEPGLVQEGFLWIDTLSAADPYWMLPIIYAGIQYFYIWNITGGKQLDETVRLAKVTGNRRVRYLSELLRVLRDGVTPCLPFAFTYWGIPSGTVLFMIGSTLGQLLSRWFVERLLPKPKVIDPAVARVPALRKSLKDQDRGLSMDNYTGKRSLAPYKPTKREQTEQTED